MTKDQFDR